MYINSTLQVSKVKLDGFYEINDSHDFMRGKNEDGKYWAFNMSTLSPELINIPEPTTEQLAQLAQSEMITELNWCDLQIKLHESSDKRAISTIDDIYAHARACRDYVQNVDGELTIVGDKPVRPS